MKKLMTAEDLTKIVSVSHPVYSPDGKKAVFTKVTVNDKRTITTSIYGFEMKRQRSCHNGHLRMESIISQCGQKTAGSLRLFCKSQRKLPSLH